ncbi:OLC1v1019197C1 [Oldenlandia corymbosa var. corymbosa]|uniref:OLC1v1019197C1 n=1 Tax=Oldenlandia corymbosa var. corymbosa TaxID=529605 RepID=A0AAV1EDF5_OLDCO|nr:OLC1v1019197C1 [Oldenlandia corymbosa var. corymbosa]
MDSIDKRSGDKLQQLCTEVMVISGGNSILKVVFSGSLIFSRSYSFSRGGGTALTFYSPATPPASSSHDSYPLISRIARNGGKGKQKDDGLTPEQRRERDAKALQEKTAKKAAQAAGGNDAGAKSNKK